MSDTPPIPVGTDPLVAAAMKTEKADVSNLQEFIATKLFGFTSFANATAAAKTEIRNWYLDFFNVVGNLQNIADSINDGSFNIDSTQGRLLTQLVNNRAVLNEFTQNYVKVIDFKNAGFTFGGSFDADNTQSEQAGYQLIYLVDKIFTPFLEAKQLVQEKVDPFNYIKSQIDDMFKPGIEFTPFFEHIDSYKKIKDFYLGDGVRPGKFRNDDPPKQIAPYQCRIGAATFFIPPTNITVHQGFTSGSLTNGALRAPNSPKSNMGHSQTEISMTLYFPNHATIWGFSGETADFDIFNWDPQPMVRNDRSEVSGQQQIKENIVSDEVIDRYLSSLRGLVTQFKYAPFLPISNEYLNRTYGITGVCMQSMTVNTIPDYPFVLAVNLNLTKFNFKPFLPMLTSFDQAIHWGKYRQYMGKASARLDAKVNQGFLIEKTTSANPGAADQSTKGNTITMFEGDLLPNFDKVKDMANGAFFDFYYPITTPSRIFAPDTTDFRQPSEDQVVTEDLWDFILSDIGLDIVSAPQFNFFEFDRAYRGSKNRNERRVLLNWMHLNSLSWKSMNTSNKDIFIEQVIQDGRKDGSINDSNESAFRTQYGHEWYFMLYEQILNDDKGFQDLKTSKDFQNSNYTIQEWNVPMDKLYIDWSTCIVNNVAVSLSNNFAQMQVQLQDEPTYQHIGGGDSRIEVNMTIIGEENLIRFRRLFEHINGLARIEKVHGVLGFLGIKNVITSLCGIKYVLPLDLEVNTIPGYPHVYSVNMSFIDFDIMQQEREQLSSYQQKQFVEQFGKRNPFLRLKQSWAAFNAYPDLPLDVRDSEGQIIGHLDPDWYFRSFTTSQSDEGIFAWGFDETISTIVNNIARLTMELLEDGLDTSVVVNLRKQLDEQEEELRTIVGDGASMPAGWKIVDGKVVPVTDGNGNKMPEPEMVIRLGLYDKDQVKASFIAFFAGGYLALGYEDIVTGEKQYQMSLGYFEEDLATKNIKNSPHIPETSPISDYQHELAGGGSNPNKQYESIMKDYDYRNLRGRMLKAFPTYMLWLIDEGGDFAGIKLFDNFYGLNSVLDFSVSLSQNAIEDTLVMRLSNIYQKLTTPYKDQIITEDDPLFQTPLGQWIVTTQNRIRNLESGMTNTIVELNNIRLKPGVRIHLRQGYGSNPNSLQTVFNGVIAEVQPGDILTVVAQSDAVEFTGYVNTVNTKGSSGKLDGGLSSFWLSEPRDLMVRLLSMGSSNFKEWLAWGSKGVFYSDSRFGIRHFGTILYESMTDQEANAQTSVQRQAALAYNGVKNDPTKSFQGVLGDYAQDLSKITSITGLSSAFNGNLIKIGKMLWMNQFSKRDYEIFKRNIYPGNGSGIAQFMGGDMIDAGLAIATASAYYPASTSTTSTFPRTEQRQSKVLFSPDGESTKVDEEAQNAADDARKKEVLDLWTQYESSIGITDDQLSEMFAQSNTGAIDLTIKKTKNEGLLESIFGAVGDIVSVPLNVLDGVDNFLTDNLPGGAFTATVLEMVAGGGFGALGKLSKFYTVGQKLLSGVGRITTSALSNEGGNGLGHILGLTSGMVDDDLSGFDEVSFRAQTYMKTVWDLFQVCAALLPNYIVAVRPFEDRSTVFYGKPHWLYTSGVIPITTGIPKDKTALPHLEGVDATVTDLLNKARQSTSSDVERMMSVIDETNALKDITSFSASKDLDPYQAGGDNITKLSTEADVKSFIDELSKSQVPHSDLIISAIEGLDFTALSPETLRYSLTLLPTLSALAVEMESSDSSVFPVYSNDPDEFKTQIKEFYSKLIEDSKENLRAKIENPELSQDKLLEILHAGNNSTDSRLRPIPGSYYDNVQTQINTLAKTDEERKKLIDFYLKDPITFAYQFGWKINTIPVWFDPTSGFGNDKVGNLARSLYDQDYSLTIDAVNGDRSLAEAKDIWGDFRNEFRQLQQVKDAYIRFYPMPDQLTRFDDVVDLFQRFLWQDPYNRAWLVNVIDKTGDGILDTVNFLGDNSNHWNWNPAVNAWRNFLSDTGLKIDPENNQIISPETRKYIEANQKAGKDAHSFFAGVAEDVTSWIDQNVGELIGLITDTISGFIASIRMSLMQMGNAVSEAGDMQRQANILNAVLYDSVYYQWGAEGSIQRLVDNPFTREYGEPVIEIREPFQRMHYVSSFDSILDNKIMENLNGVATVVTAVSDGKYPVTVHFDKGISPERQVEKVVETGLLWDNAVGSGLFGFLQPLLHPLETLRSYTKTATGSSDQLSARRVALWHLKQSLQSIYAGEIVVLGDADMRPYDMLYIADIYERMYGMVEIQQVIHHFTPETGFVTAVTPCAIVTINDPVRYTFLSYIWSKMTNFNLRDDTRAMMNIGIERSIANGSQALLDTDIYKNFSTQMNGSIQYTQGSTALIRDIGCMFSGGGLKALDDKDKALNAIAKVDLTLGLIKNGAPLAAGIVATGLTGPTGGIIAATGAWAVSDLLWEGWQWVKENLLDQHGCYIQYMNKDGQPMDAGLSVAQGVAVGTNHSIALFPSIVGLSGRVTVKEDGHYRITINDMLASLGYTEIETLSIYRSTSMFVNQINSDILKITGRNTENIPNDNFISLKVRVLDPNGENVGSNQAFKHGVEDGDTLNVRVLESVEGYSAGQIIRVRVSFVNAYELQFHDDSSTAFDETLRNATNDMGRLALEYLNSRFALEANRTLALRINRHDQLDKYGRTLAVIFHNVPLGTPSSDRANVLKKYAQASPPLSLDSYMDDGRPYTLNWEMVMTGYGSIDMRESLWDTSWRKNAVNQGVL